MSDMNAGVAAKSETKEYIVKAFSVTRGETCAKKLARALFDSLTDEKIAENTASLIKEWEVLFHLSENDSGQSSDIEKRRRALSGIFDCCIEDNLTEYKALFALQTTYAIVVKLIAYKTVTKLTSGETTAFFDELTDLHTDTLRDLLWNIENGYNITSFRVRNLPEGDFFCWYCNFKQWNTEIFEAVKEVLLKLEDYTYIDRADSFETIDIFRELYMEVMPNEVRHSLGEYYTPAWLSDKVVKEAIGMSGPGWKGVDPCCGSGVFVTTMIRYIRMEHENEERNAENDRKLLNEILSRVKGIDINPLSALTARVSYFLAIADLLYSLDTDEESIEIPVYMGDSARPSDKFDYEGIEWYEASIMIHGGETLDVKLPASFVESKDFYSKMSRLDDCIESYTAEDLCSKLLGYINIEVKNDVVSCEAKKLCDSLINMRNEGIAVKWMRIIANYMRVAQLGEHTIILGNPPWVKWEHLPQKYAEKIKELCVEKHLFSGQSYMGAICLNLCALIANETATHWLSENGVLAFLMPYTLLTQDSYAGFRNFYLDHDKKERLYLQKIEDWTKSGNPFIYTTEPFATFYYKKDEVDYSNGIPVEFYRKKRGVDVRHINTYSMYSDVKRYYDIKSGMAVQVDENRTGYSVFEGGKPSFVSANIIGECAYKARTGAEFTPSEVYWLTYNADRSSKKRNYFDIVALNGATHKNTMRNGVCLENKFVYPLIKGPCIEKYHLNYDSQYCIFPYYVAPDKDGNMECYLVDEDRLENDAEKTWDYLMKHKSLINRQSSRSKLIKRNKTEQDENSKKRLTQEEKSAIAERRFYALSKVGLYSFADVAVAFRDNTRMDATVVKSITTEWGEVKQPIFAKHAPFISMDVDGNFITEDEAYYISGILNTKVVEEYFKATFSGRSYSIKFNIYMPKYDPNNKLHKTICDLSRELHQKYGDPQILMKNSYEIERAYLDMCRSAFLCRV